MHGGNENGPFGLEASITLPRTGSNVWVHERQASQKQSDRADLPAGAARLLRPDWHGFPRPMPIVFSSIYVWGIPLGIPFSPIEAHAALHGAAMRCLESWRPGAESRAGAGSELSGLSCGHQRHRAVTFSPFLDPSGMLGFLDLASPERVGFLDGKEALHRRADCVRATAG